VTEPAAEIRVAHRLGREGARERLQALAARHGIAVESADGFRGTLQKSLPLVGAVRAEFEVLDQALVVRIVQAPAFPSIETIRRKVSEELGKIVS
jgi:hypothetical protein